MEPILPGTSVSRHEFKRGDGAFAASFAFSRATLPNLKARRVEFLYPAEEVYFQTLGVDARRLSFLIGRYCVKEALAVHLRSPAREKWEVGRGVFQQPVLIGPGTEHLQASLSHSGTAGVAVVYPEAHPLGVDLEEIKPDRRTAILSQLTPAEQGQLAGVSGNQDENLALVWTAKEALSKVLRTGLMTPFTLYEMERLEWDAGGMLGEFKNFAQYRAITFSLGDLAFALVLPKRSMLDRPVAEFRRGLFTPGRQR